MHDTTSLLAEARPLEERYGPRLHKFRLFEVLGLLQWVCFGVIETILRNIVINLRRFKGVEEKLNNTLYLQLQSSSSTIARNPEAIGAAEVQKEVDILADLNSYYASSRKNSLRLSSGIKDSASAFFKIIFWILVFVVCLPLGLLAVVLRFSLYPLRAVFLYAPAAKDKQLSPGDTLSIKTWNVALTEMGIMNVINLLPSSRSRIGSVIDESLVDSPDVICWQEMFHPFLASEYAVPYLNAQGYSVVYASRPRHLIGMNSGILIASKCPIVDVDFFPYRNPTGLNWFANKGVLAAKLRVYREGIPHYIVITNTHALCAEWSPPNVDRAQYLLQLYGDHFADARSFTDRFSSQAPPASAILAAGDFNTSRFQSPLGRPGISTQYDYLALERFVHPVGGTPFKDLTFADVSIPTAQTCVRGLRFMNGVADNESGSMRGSSVFTESFSFRYSVDAIVASIVKHPDFPHHATSLHGCLHSVVMAWHDRDEQAQDRLLAQIGIAAHVQEKLGPIMRAAMAQYKERVSLNAQVLDHIFLQQPGPPLLSDVGYRYVLDIPLRGGRVVSDHCPVFVSASVL